MNNRVRELRQSHNMTLDELGKKIGVQKSNMAKYERGEVDMKATTLLKLSEIFGVSIDYILGNANTARPLDVEENTPLTVIQENEITKATEGLGGQALQTLLNLAGLLKTNANSTRLSDDETKLIDDYRALDKSNKTVVEKTTNALRIANDSAKIKYEGTNINNNIKFGNVLSPANITATQNVN